MDVEELVDLLDICVCSYNGTPQRSLGDVSPLESLQCAFANARTLWLPRRLPPISETVTDLDVERLVKPVRGNQKAGRRPYVQIEHVRYTNPILARSPKLIGQRLRIDVRWNDLRTVRAFLPSGEDLGILSARGNWSRTPHDLKLRRQITAAIRDGSLRVPPGNDPVQDFLTAKARQAVEEKQARGSKRVAVSRAATDVARIAQVSKLPIPHVDQPRRESTPETPLTDKVVHLPSFLPRIRHRGIVK